MKISLKKKESSETRVKKFFCVTQTLPSHIQKTKSAHLSPLSSHFSTLLHSQNLCTQFKTLDIILISIRSVMQDIFGSVRRSLVLRSPDDDSTAVGTLVDKIKCIRKSRMFSKLSPPPQPLNSPTAPTIRWRKGEMIGCGAFGQVYMGMNLDSGELLAVKQVNLLFRFLISSLVTGDFC